MPSACRSPRQPHDGGVNIGRRGCVQSVVDQSLRREERLPQKRSPVASAAEADVLPTAIRQEVPEHHAELRRHERCCSDRDPLRRPQDPPLGLRSQQHDHVLFPPPLGAMSRERTPIDTRFPAPARSCLRTSVSRQLNRGRNGRAARAWCRAYLPASPNRRRRRPARAGSTSGNTAVIMSACDQSQPLERGDVPIRDDPRAPARADADTITWDCGRIIRLSIAKSGVDARCRKRLASLTDRARVFSSCSATAWSLHGLSTRQSPSLHGFFARILALAAGHAHGTSPHPGPR